MARAFLALVMAACSLTIAAPAAASDKGWDDASTIVDAALIAAALGVPLLEDDRHGVEQAGGSVLAAIATTSAFKQIFPEVRPDGSDRRSFPSGHTAQAFAAAASLQQRQGWRVGVPAHIAAAFVGYARVEARKHHWYDVVVGAAIGETSGLLITNHRPSNVAIMPWGDTHGAGISIAARF